MNKSLLLFFLAICFVFTSCKMQEKPSQLNYLQNVEEIATEASQRNSQQTIQKGDELMIFVSAKNMDVVKPFNQTYFGSQNAIAATPATNPTADEKTYLVDAQGNIDFPIIGSINTYDKTLETLKNELTDKITSYVKNPTVTVKLSNFKITVLGEVEEPGQYAMPGTNATVLNALGLAGDLKIHGRRDDVLIVRNVDGEIKKGRINLRDANFINSDFYYLKQGDVIYVSATETQEKTARQDPNTTVYIAIAGTLVGLAGIFITIFKK